MEAHLDFVRRQCGTVTAAKDVLVAAAKMGKAARPKIWLIFNQEKYSQYVSDVAEAMAATSS